MSTLVAVDGCTIDHASGSLVSGGIFTIISVASTKVKAEGNGIYSTVIAFTYLGGTYSGGASNSATGGGTITTTAEKAKVEGGLVFLEGDTGDLIGTYLTTSTPSVTTPFTSSVEITDAGQLTVKAK